MQLSKGLNRSIYDDHKAIYGETMQKSESKIRIALKY